MTPSALRAARVGPLRCVARWLTLALMTSAACERAPEPSAATRASAPQGSAPTQSPPAPRRRAEVVRAPEGAGLDFVRAEVERGAKEGRPVLVYVGATWCEPCAELHRGVEQGAFDEVLDGARLLEFDADRDTESLGAAGYSWKYVPYVAVPLSDGRASGRAVEGATKGQPFVPQLQRRLGALLRSRG